MPFDMRAAEGKIKGRGTTVCAKPVCTWGWHSTCHIAAPCRQVAKSRMVTGLAVCFLRQGMPRCARAARHRMR
ncbi:hypothetical protein IPC1272_19390 [Pseudomonas aeruginosa]|nr:hypothetical protein AO947_32665 [Pseudomonas aeruginosa]RMJ53196.1 hypothetical protein IPC1272_19390 [Pseudomonas aeruginosa]